MMFFKVLASALAPAPAPPLQVTAAAHLAAADVELLQHHMGYQSTNFRFAQEKLIRFQGFQFAASIPGCLDRGSLTAVKDFIFVNFIRPN